MTRRIQRQERTAMSNLEFYRAHGHDGPGWTFTEDDEGRHWRCPKHSGANPK